MWDHALLTSKQETPIDFFKDDISDFRSFVDGAFQPKGIGSNSKQAEPLTIDDEEMIWNKTFLAIMILNHSSIMVDFYLFSVVVMNTSSCNTILVKLRL